MGFVKNKPGEEQAPRKLFTGLAKVTVVAVNPTQQQLQSLGFKAENTPKYKEMDGGVLRTRICMILSFQDHNGEDHKVMHNFFIKNKLVDGIFIDKMGRFGQDRSKLQQPNRNAFDGEIDLVQFTKAYFNVGKEEEACFDSMSAEGGIAKAGNVSEIQEMFRESDEYACKVLLGVKDDKYQHVFSGGFERAWSTDHSYLHQQVVRHLEKSQNPAYYGPISPDVYSAESYELREVTPQSSTTTPLTQQTANQPATTQPTEAQMQAQIEDPWGNNAAAEEPQAEETVSDSPFGGF